MHDLADRMVEAYKHTRLAPLVMAASESPPYLVEDKWVFSYGPLVELPLLRTSADAGPLFCRHLRARLAAENALLLNVKVSLSEHLEVEWNLFAAPFLFPSGRSF